LLSAPVHELAITRNVVAIAGEAAQGQRVTRVMIEIGRLSCVMATWRSRRWLFPRAAAMVFPAGTIGCAGRLKRSGRRRWDRSRQ